MPIPAGAKSGKCTLCAHPACVQAELLLAGGASFNSVSRKYGVTRHAIGRHWAGHVSPERKAALALGPVQRMSLSAQVAEESESVLAHHRATRAGLLALYAAAVTAGDRVGGALLGGRLTEVNNAIARLCGQLATSPLISNTTINNTMTAVFESPKFLKFENALLALATEHPEIHPRLLAIIKLLDDEEPAAQRPALEHQVVPETASNGV